VCDLETSRIGTPYIYDISSLRVNDLTLILLTWRKWWANNASKQQIGFNSAFKGLKIIYHSLKFVKNNTTFLQPPYLWSVTWQNEIMGSLPVLFALPLYQLLCNGLCNQDAYRTSCRLHAQQSSRTSCRTTKAIRVLPAMNLKLTDRRFEL